MSPEQAHEAVCWKHDEAHDEQGSARDPFPPDCLKLQGWNELYRVRLEGWSIVYQINARRKTVLVWRVRPRAKAYLGLEPL
jgi:mRNA-degrading endonuclease RelE of RelBE toxin-antitoxin system